MEANIEISKEGIIKTKLVEAEDLAKVREWTEVLKKTIKELHKKTKKKIKILTDLTECSISSSVGARQIIAEMEKENEPYVEKSAAYTPNLALRSIANLVGKISRRRNFLVFKTKEEAIKWLKAGEKGKTKEDVIKETVHEVYTFLKETHNHNEDEILDYICKLHNYSGMDTDKELELYGAQNGAFIIAFNYLKENPKISEQDAINHIVENYSDLLAKYSQG